MIKTIALVVIAAPAGLLVYASTQPDVFQVQRATHIKASPDNKKGPGSTYRFKGNMAEPFASHNIVEFTLQPQGDGTDVTWAMRGPSNLVSKVMGVVFDMDKMVGRENDTSPR
ncbi:MAG: hypothetical protein QM749_17095 [Aquabacterium sp.]